MGVEVYIRVQEIDHRGAQQMKDIHMPTQSMGESGEQNSSGPVMEIDKSQEATSAGRNRLIWEACLPQLGSVLMSEAPVITEGSEDARSLGHRMCHVGAPGPCHHRNHPDLSGLHCHLGAWRYPGQSCS